MDINSNILDKFIILNKDIKSAIFSYKGSCKHDRIKEILIYIGKIGFGTYSYPEESSLELNNYNSFSISFLDENRMVICDDFKLDKKLNQFKNDFSHFYKKVPIELAKKFLEDLILVENKCDFNKCDFCGDYDKYASFKNGKVRCYRCMDR